VLQQKPGTAPAPTISSGSRSRRVALISQIKESIGESSDPLPTRADIAKKFRVHERTVDRWIAAKMIPYLKIGACVRFRWGDVERALSRLTVKEVK
jgi:excisionase family DNA binding protein